MAIQVALSWTAWRLAGETGRVAFPIGLDKPGNLDFSFSGVKTSLYYHLREMKVEEVESQRAHIAAGYQAAVVSALIKKTLAAAESRHCDQICLAGGVSANSELRRRPCRRM